MKRPESPSLRETLRGVRDQLGAAGVESPGAEAERLLAHVLGVERSRLALEASTPLPAGAARDLARLVARRAAGRPLQHLEGTVAFRDLVLRADGRALIPRPETEQLVELIARQLGAGPDGSQVRAVSRPDSADNSAGSALDIGTGSGAIALSLVAEGLASRVLAFDVSEEALAQARENRDLAGLDPERVELRLVGPDPFEALKRGERFDLLVSNPPYVRDADIEGLPVEVREHEPRAALAGGADGLDLVRTIAARGPEALRPGGRLFLEIGADQGREATALFEAVDGWEKVVCHADLSGRDRFLCARRR
ncbi:MAG TPA: peptide chain release factor N(5)-glutamine methyltransferase [Gemmatimonadota bacterium]|nr:peptide chain release factor N(5)-glutamine methyltransferase [Gemmatimonadota bacterium]